MPTDAASFDIVKGGFTEIADFSNEVGVVDGTRVHIKSPSKDERICINRKTLHSIIVVPILVLLLFCI